MQDRVGVLRCLLADVWQMVWGFPQTIVGLIVCLCVRGAAPLRMYRTSLVTEWHVDAGLSLGMFIFVPRHAHHPLLVHEYGHSLQSMLLGPFYLPIIVLPSLVWAGLPAFDRYRNRRNFSYYRFFPERWANLLAHMVTGERPIGWY